MAKPKFSTQYKILLAILLVASGLRLWNLQNIPPHLRNDEAALGYNAYSILQTNKDEHGRFLPVVFQSFGDFKMGLYVYLTVPFISVLGLNEVAVRVPSALAGIISVWLIYEIMNLLFAKIRLAFISALIFAISPINIAFSRGAWEVNVSLALTLAGIYFFLKAFYGKDILIVFSALLFGLTLLTSHTAKFSTPVLILILSFSFFNKLRKINKKLILLSCLISLLFVIPILQSIIGGQITRLTTLSIFSYQSGYPLFQSILNRWFSFYAPSSLFLSGDTNPQHTAPNTGPFLFLDIVFLIVGIITLVRAGTKPQKLFIFLGLLLLSLPSALTIEKVNFERILPVFMPIIILMAIGIDKLLEGFNKRFISVLLFTLIFFYSLNYLYFLDQYFVHGPKKNDAWQYGYKQIVEKVNTFQSQYPQVLVQQSYEHPYIFFLFYQKYDPERYQRVVKEVFIPNKEGKDMGLVSRLDNIEFSDIDWSVKKPEAGILYVMPVYKLNQQSKYSSSYKSVGEIKDLNGFPLFKIIETI